MNFHINNELRQLSIIIIAVVISIPLFSQESASYNYFFSPEKTVVIQKKVESNEPRWRLYEDEALVFPNERVSSGDSVSVIGVIPGFFIIRFGESTRYVSRSALFITSRMQAFLTFFDREFTSIQNKERTADSLLKNEWEMAKELKLIQKEEERDILPKEDSIELVNSSPAFLRLTSNKKNIVIGECAILDLAFYVNDSNKERLRFYELGMQIDSIMKNYLFVRNCWKSNSFIEVINAEPISVGTKHFSMYKLYSAAYCPKEAQDINIQPITLRLEKLRVGNEVESIRHFTTKPLKVSVTPIPPGNAPTTSDGFRMVGSFTLKDYVFTDKVCTNFPFKYSISIIGEGLTFPLVIPHELKLPKLSARLINVLDSDTIIDNTYLSKKNITYALTYTEAGRYSLSDFIKLTYYNPNQKNSVKIYSERIIEVEKSAHALGYSQSPSFFKSDNIIAIDVSQSMQIEDYTPYRLKASLMGIQNFLAKRKTCDIGIIAFGGNAIPLNVSKKDSCYANTKLNAINFDLVARGTSIGDAICLAVRSLSQSGKAKKLVIIGDGDNTSGHWTSKDAAMLARKYNLKIYTIGIGHTGPVPFGRDIINGTQNIINNTFSDLDFKMISQTTNGNYYWAKDSAAVTKLLTLIFLNE